MLVEVLILVVVDNGLVQLLQVLNVIPLCLNPCCSGQWSRTRLGEFGKQMVFEVLILVVVDNGLVR